MIALEHFNQNLLDSTTSDRLIPDQFTPASQAYVINTLELSSDSLPNQSLPQSLWIVNLFIVIRFRKQSCFKRLPSGLSFEIPLMRLCRILERPSVYIYFCMEQEVLYGFHMHMLGEHSRFTSKEYGMINTGHKYGTVWNINEQVTLIHMCS